MHKVAIRKKTFSALLVSPTFTAFQKQALSSICRVHRSTQAFVIGGMGQLVLNVS
jgi:hypothetical protein